MSTSAFIAWAARVGTVQLADSTPGAATVALAITAGVVMALVGLRWWFSGRRGSVPLLPIPPEDTQPWPAPRPQCPWCDTHACIDSTLCNCEQPCGSWLCEAKEASRG